MPWSSRTPEPYSLEFRRNVPFVKLRDKNTCQVGGYDCLVNLDIEVDHIVPRAEGGGDGMNNLRCICTSCHKKKTHQESQRSRKRNKEKGKHPWTRMKHPGMIFRNLRQTLMRSWRSIWFGGLAYSIA